MPGQQHTEDAALVTVCAIALPLLKGAGIAFSVGFAGLGVPPMREEWAEMFGQLKASVQPAAAG